MSVAGDVLSREQAIQFVKDVLGLNEVEEMLKDDRLQALNGIVKSFMTKEPFQSADFLSTPAHVRSVPGLSDNIQACLSQRGGLCWTLNSFMHLLLQGLGFSTYMVPASPETILDHAIVIVQDLLRQGDKYLIDVGFGCPTFTAICLDFETESPVFTESFNIYKYTRKGNTYTRCHHHREGALEAQEMHKADEFIEKYHFDLLPAWSMSDMIDLMQRNVYTRPDIIFTSSLRYVAFDDQLRCSALKDNTFLLEDDNNKLVPHKLDNEEERHNIFKKYFALVPLEIMEKAFNELTS